MAGATLDASRPCEWLQCVCCGGEDIAQKLLLCFHPCCEQCLQVISTDSDILTCPNCSTITTGLFRWGTLHDNFLKEIQQHAAALIEPKQCITCKPLGKSNIGTHICLDCDGGHFCPDCIKMHGHIPATRSHRPIPLSELDIAQVKAAAKSLQSVPTCPDHHTDTQPQHLNFYCEPCKTAVCKTCWSVHHQTGDHQVIMLSQLSQKKCEILDKKTSTLKQLIKVLGGILTASTKILEKNEAAEEGLRNKVKGRATALKQAVDSDCQSYLAQIADFYKDWNGNLLRQNQEVKQLVQQMETTIRFRESFQSTCSEGTIVKYHDVVDTGLQRIHSQVEAMPKHLPEGTIILETPARKVTSLRTDDFLGRLIRPDTFAQALHSGQVKVTMAWSVTLDTLEDIKGLDFNASGDVLLVGNSKASDKYIHVYSDEGDAKRNIKINIKKPHNISVKDDDILVSDRFGSIVVMDTRGQVRCTHKIPGIKDGSVGLAMAKHGEIYATTGQTNRLVKCTDGGSEPEELGLAKENFSLPCYLCLTPQGCIAVSNHGSHRISVLDRQGRLQFYYGSYGRGDGQLYGPLGVCSDSAGRLYIADLYNHRVSITTPTGAFLANVVTKEHGVLNPRCVGLNGQGTRLAVAHSKNKLTIFKTQL